MNPSGLLLLSATEISDVSYVDYHPNTTEILERGYLKAEVGCRSLIKTYLQIKDFSAKQNLNYEQYYAYPNIF